MISSAGCLSVVVPAFNEASRIGGTIDALRSWLLNHVAEWEIRIVDDGSTDATVAIVEDHARGDARVIAQREPHRGKGGTVRAGMLAATGSRRFMCDADLSMPIEQLERFLALVPSSCDIAIGSREGLGARRIGEPAYRHVLGRGFNALVRAAVVPHVQDTQCGFKLFSASAADRIFPRLTIDGWAFDVEMMAIAARQGWRVGELPIEWHYERESRVSPLRDSLQMVRDIWRIRSNAARGLYTD